MEEGKGMISLDFVQAKGELLDGIWRETGNEQAVKIAAVWLKRWIKELHVSHTFSREILEHHSKDVSGLIEHTHRRMYYEAGDAIFRSKFAVMNTEVNTDEDGRPHPFVREDRLTIYLVAT